MKLFELHINNFKFFLKQDSNSPLLKINGKNLLIYGENGSGKSTIYWALHALLESSFKEKDADVAKYFIPKGKYSLVNIHAGKKPKTHIKAVLKDPNDLSIQEEFLVSGDLPTIKKIRAKTEVKESNYASDFLNYRTIFQLHNLKHTEDNDLFKWFLDEILLHIKNGTTNELEIFENLKKGPVKIRDINGDVVYPTADLQNSTVPEEKKDYVKYSTYKKNVASWNKRFKDLLKKITEQANLILKNDFNYDFEIKLDLEPAKFSVTKDSKNFIPPKITLLIPKYNKESNVVSVPHTFLNEAKWTAIGISIRFAILDNRLYSAPLKCLVLDDILLSLDMSNRDKIMKIIFERYSTLYQLFFFTHDRYLYEYIKRKYSNQIETDWNILEVYAIDKLENGITISSPLVVSGSPSFLADGLRNVHSTDRPDYPAAASYFRKYAEEILCNFLPEEFQYDIDKETETFNKTSYVLNKIASFAIKEVQKRVKLFLLTIKQDTSLIDRLGDELYLLMHPLSHSYLEHPVFKSELIKVSELLQELNIFLNTTKSKFKAVLFQGNWINLKIETAERGNFFYELKIKDTVFVYKNPTDNSLQFSDTTFHTGYCYKEGATAKDSLRKEIIDTYTGIEDAYLKIKAFAGEQNFTVTNVTDYVSIIEFKRNEPDIWEPLSNLQSILP